MQLILELRVYRIHFVSDELIPSFGLKSKLGIAIDILLSNAKANAVTSFPYVVTYSFDYDPGQGTN